MFPRISVVIPSFNQGDYIERTIVSILAQQYSNLELILMDGESSDATMSIVQRYRNNFAAIVSEKDGGQADAIKKGFGLANGEIFAWLNSDDRYAPGALSFVGEFFAANPDVCLLYGDYAKIGPNDEVLEHKRQPSFHLGIMKYAYLTIPQQAAFWTSHSYRAVGGVNPSFRFTMDYDLFVRLALTGGRVVHAKRELAYFRIHPTSKTSTLEDIRQREDDRVRALYCAIKPGTRLFPLVEASYRALLVFRCLIEGCLWEKLWHLFRRKSVGALHASRQ